MHVPPFYSKLIKLWQCYSVVVVCKLNCLTVCENVLKCEKKIPKLWPVYEMKFSKLNRIIGQAISCPWHDSRIDWIRENQLNKLKCVSFWPRLKFLFPAGGGRVLFACTPLQNTSSSTESCQESVNEKERACVKCVKCEVGTCICK